MVTKVERKRAGRAVAKMGFDPISFPIGQRRSWIKRRVLLRKLAVGLDEKRKSDRMTLGSFYRLKPELRRDMRLAGARLEAPAAKKSKKDAAKAAMQQGVRALLAQHQTYLTGKRIAEILREAPAKYFRGPPPYWRSKSTFAREVALALSIVRPSHKKAP